MTHEHIVDCLEPIEKRYKQDYSGHEQEIFYKQYSWMTNEMWRTLCGLVLAKDFYRIPSKDDFVEIEQAHPDKFKRIQKVSEECDICKSSGMRRFLQIGKDKRHAVPVARCDCGNGKKWTYFPSVELAERLVGFVRWLGCHESDFGAVTDADRAGLAARMEKGPEEKRAKDTDKVPS